MPTVLRFDGLRVVVYPNDHRPVHVHVFGRGCEAVFNLNCAAGPVRLRENYGFSQSEIARIRRKLAKHLAALCSAWEKIHGIAY
jgi:DNA-binding MarR family transcriptional regulator